ncbi:actin [Spironucleus salmonicida]|uniref:Actin n=1 Tax=Spironucleus salmonicida TaxID=348837 RepID=V6LXB2_9EUKA|nr:actin [Spironucleus salmonicida]|eukprot:EST49267.1 Actin related protein [Spironucleus salmonicida]
MSYIIDIGSYMTRQGITGNVLPDLQFRSIFLTERYQKASIQHASKARQPYGSQQIPLYTLENAITSGGKELFSGAIFDLLHHSLLDIQLDNLLILLPPTIPTLEQKILLNRIFDELSVDKLSMLQTPATSLYSAGRVDGLVVDSGETLTRVQCVIDGFATDQLLQKGAGRWATRDLFDAFQANGHLSLIFDDESRQMNDEAELWYCDLLKQQISGEGQTLRLPDGQMVQIPLDGYLQTVARNAESVCRLISRAVEGQSSIFRTKLLSNIVVAGGNSMTYTFQEQMLQTLQKQHKVTIFAQPNRNSAQWTGASAIASLSSFKSQYCTKQQWQEKGFQ